MSVSYLFEAERGLLEKGPEIIVAIRKSDRGTVEQILAEDPNQINSVDFVTGQNAAMLCVSGRMPKLSAEVLQHAHALDLRHLDRFGHDLLDVAGLTGSEELVDLVLEVYERSGKHLLNNWPDEPSVT
jgi:hypothetical protein